MNIRLDDDIRIRLDDVDVKSWIADAHLVRVFPLGKAKFRLELKIDDKADRSWISSDADALTIFLTSRDATRLASKLTPDARLVIQDISIEVDRWSQDKRKRLKGQMRSQ